MQAYARRAGVAIFAAVLVSLTSTASFADTSPVPPDALALVRELSADNVAVGMAQTMRQMLLTTIPKQSTLSPADTQSLVDRSLTPGLMSGTVDLEQAVAGVYASHFTVPELRELRAFAADRTPPRQKAFLATATGRKYLAEQGAITNAIEEAARHWAGRIVRAAAVTHPDDIKALSAAPVISDVLTH